MPESITNSNTLEFTDGGVSNVKMVATNSTLTCSSSSGDIDLFGIKDITASGEFDINQLSISNSIKLADTNTQQTPVDGEGVIYKKNGNDGIFWKPDSAGVEVDLTTAPQYNRILITNASSPYTILPNDEIIGVDTTSGSVNLILPAINTIGGNNNYRKYHIVDEGGNTYNNNIIVNTSSGDTINKKTSPIIINIPHTSISLYSNGISNWNII